MTWETLATDTHRLRPADSVPARLPLPGGRNRGWAMSLVRCRVPARPWSAASAGH